jgi:hypothetical protein
VHSFNLISLEDTFWKTRFFMKPQQYHALLGALDHALELFDRFAADLSVDDQHVRDDLELMRSKILRAESGHPFPFKFRLMNEEDSDFDMTRTPWFK